MPFDQHLEMMGLAGWQFDVDLTDGALTWTVKRELRHDAEAPNDPQKHFTRPSHVFLDAARAGKLDHVLVPVRADPPLVWIAPPDGEENQVRELYDRVHAQAAYH